MGKRLTAIGVAALRARERRFEVPDGGNGLYVEVTPSGHKSFTVRYRFQGKPTKVTLSSGLTLAEARHEATRIRLEVSRGTDPAAAKRAVKQAARAVTTDTVRRAIEQFLDQHARKKTRRATWMQCESIFRREVLPKWAGTPVADVTRKDVRELLRAIAATRPIVANRCQAYLSRFFRWCVNEDIITGTPMVGIERPAKENVRDRALSDDEIRRFWAATDTLPVPFPSIYRLLLLSGARRQEVAEMQWRELDLARKLWTIPAARSKSRVAHMLPLGPLAWSIIEAQPHISDYVFGHRRSGFSHIKPILDAAMKPNAPWKTHDLRRTSRSLMARAMVLTEIAERMIGHLPRGIVKTYDVHDHVDTKREGFAKLEREISLIVNPVAANVTPMWRAT